MVAAIVGAVMAGSRSIPFAMASSNNNDRGISNVSVRIGTLSDAKSLTTVINDAFRPVDMFKVPGAHRVTPDGKRGADHLR